MKKRNTRTSELLIEKVVNINNDIINKCSELKN